MADRSALHGEVTQTFRRPQRIVLKSEGSEKGSNTAKSGVESSNSGIAEGPRDANPKPNPNSFESFSLFSITPLSRVFVNYVESRGPSAT